MNINLNMIWNNPDGIKVFNSAEEISGEMFPVRFYKYSAAQIFIARKSQFAINIELSTIYMDKKDTLREETLFDDLPIGKYIIDRDRKKILAAWENNSWKVSDLGEFEIKPSNVIKKFLIYFEGINDFSTYEISYYKMQEMLYLLSQARYVSLKCKEPNTKFGEKLVYFMTRDTYLKDATDTGIELRNSLNIVPTREYILDKGLTDKLTSLTLKMINKFEENTKKKETGKVDLQSGEVQLTDLIKRKSFSEVVRVYPSYVNINYFPAGNGIKKLTIVGANVIIATIKESALITKDDEELVTFAESFKVLMEFGDNIIVNAYCSKTEKEVEEDLCDDIHLYE